MIGVKIDGINGGRTEQALSASIEGKPNAMIFKGMKYGIITANICAKCGYTELSCGNLEALWSAYCSLKPQTKK